MLPSSAGRAKAVAASGHASFFEGGDKVKLYSYFRSSAAYRVRIAFNLKNLSYDTVPIHLQKEGGINRKPDYQAVNPQMRVPALRLDSGEILTQSLAIIEFLDELHPQPPLLPRDPIDRAKVRALAQLIACDIHPLNNVGPLRYLKNQLGQDQAAIDAWYHHWILEGFDALEAMIRPGPYAYGSEVTLADICLVPQVANARRFNVPLDKFPKIVAVDAACLKLPAFDKARPENQPDAE
jgi:maleylacetoacetate isomerase